LQHQGKGYALESLTTICKDVALFIQNYLTCEGHYRVIFSYHLKLLSHVRYNVQFNIPYFMLTSLQLMACSVRSGKHPLEEITNHGLVKVSILDSLGSTQMTWRKFPGLLEESVEEQQEEAK
jgi:hypothetical protein